MTAPGAGAPSALWPVIVAIAAAGKAFAPLAAKLGEGAAGVFAARAPAGAALDYVVIGEGSESAGLVDTGARALHRVHRGAEIAVTIHIYSKDAETWEGVLAIYAELRRLLHGTTLAVPGFEHLRGELEFLTAIPDPASEGTHGIARYSASTRSA